MRFVGWVPSVTGRVSFFSLSFSHLTRNPTNVPIISPDRSRRFAIARHYRLTNDSAGKAIPRSLVPKWAMPLALRLDWNPKDTFQFLLVTQATADDERLAGRVYVLKPLAFAARWEAVFDKFLVDVRTSGLRQNGDPSPICAKLASDIEQLAQQENPAHFISAEITLKRNGQCTVEVPDLGPPTWPGSPAERAAYVFMFVRDIFHAHYHHADSDDRLVPLVEGTDEQNWADQTERALFRSVLNARRNGHHQDLIEAEGRIAYLSAFRTLFPRCVKERDLAHIGTSLAASIAQKKVRIERKAIGTTLFLAIPFALFELSVHLREAATGEHRITSSPLVDNLGIFFERLYDAVSFDLAATVALLYIILFFYGCFSGLLDVNRWRLTRALTRSMTIDLRLGALWRVYLVKAASGLLYAFAAFLFLMLMGVDKFP